MIRRANLENESYIHHIYIHNNHIYSLYNKKKNQMKICEINRKSVKHTPPVNYIRKHSIK